MDLETLKIQYDADSSRYERLCREQTLQLDELLRQASLTLAMPIEARVKSWDSIADKCERNNLHPDALDEIEDIAGLRLIFLFKRDEMTARGIIVEHFSVVSEEDAAKRLSADQFGYTSMHYIVQPKESWLSIPTMAPLAGLKAEIQVRTAAQHIWAATSHTLQYKREAHVPEPVRKSITRVAALLDLVDLEFERVLDQRDEYTTSLDVADAQADLNADLVRRLAADHLPPENASEDTQFGEVLDELEAFGVSTVGDFVDLIDSTRDAVAQKESENVASGRELLKSRGTAGTSNSRQNRGVFFTHEGLIRVALQSKFGAAYSEYQRKQTDEVLTAPKPTKPSPRRRRR